MRGLIRWLAALSALAAPGVAGDFIGLDAPNQVIYDIDSQSGRVLAMRKLWAPPGVVLGAMDRGPVDYFPPNRLLVTGTTPTSDLDLYEIREWTGGVSLELYVSQFGPGLGDAGLLLDGLVYILSTAPTGAELSDVLIFGPTYSNASLGTTPILGGSFFGLALDVPGGLFTIERNAAGSRLLGGVGTLSGPVVIAPVLGAGDSLGFSLEEHPTPGLLYLFSPGDEALYTIDVTTAGVNLLAPLPGSGRLTSLVRRNRYPIEFCFGNGELEPGCGGCPCSNDAPLWAGGGCLNSLQLSGRLRSVGEVTSSADTLRFEATELPPSSFAILVAGQTALPVQGPCPLGSGIQSGSLDGIRCVGSGVVRLGTRGTDAAGEIGATNAGWGPPDGPVAGLGARAGVAPGVTRYFQVFYRDVDLSSGCGSGLNTTQAVAVTGE